MKNCKKCLYPETKPHLKFNEDGVCDACTAYENRNEINWNKRKKELIDILEKNKNKDGSNYDCLIPISGGKDSTYQVWYIKNLGYNPLCVMATTCDMSELGRKNIDNIRKNLEVDIIEVASCLTTRHKLNKFSLETIGDPSWPEHTTVYTVPLNIAIKFNIKLIIWGEAANEYGSTGIECSLEQKFRTLEYQQEFGSLNGLRSNEICEITDIEPNKLIPYMYPKKEDLKKLDLKEIFLGYFVPWDPYKNFMISTICGMESYPKKLENAPVNYISLDDYHVNIRDYFKYLKYGFGRYTDHLSQYIRRGLISREECVTLVIENDGPYPHSYLGKSLNEILETINLTKEEFDDLCDNYTNRAIFEYDDQKNDFVRRPDGSPKLKIEIS